METVAEVQKYLESFVESGHEQPRRMPVALHQPHDVQMEQIIPIPSSSGIVSNLISGDESALQIAENIAEQALQGGYVVDGVYQTITVVTTDEYQGEMGSVASSKENKSFEEDKQAAEGTQNSEIESDEVSPNDTKTRTIHFTERESQIDKPPVHACNLCSYTSHKKSSLTRHMKSHSEKRPHKCGLCDKGFKTSFALGNHINSHVGIKPHACKDCESSFGTSGDLLRHVRYRHTLQKPHKCTECEYASVESSKLKVHMRSHTGERPYQCPHCTYASPDNFRLKRHLRVHTGEKPYKCDICQAEFSQANSLNLHKSMHSENRPAFHCEFCENTFSRKRDLRLHMQKLHTSDIPLECTRCLKIFPDKYSYKLHLKTHKGEKCFKCDLCPYASVYQHHLKSHMISHTGQNPFPCDECTQAFRQKKMLELHKNLYHNPNPVLPIPEEKIHACSDCGRHFKHKGHLIRHLAIHNRNASVNANKAEAPSIRRLRIRAPRAFVEQQIDEEEEGEINLSSTIEIETHDDKKEIVTFEGIGLHTQEGKTDTLSEDGIIMTNGKSVKIAVLEDMEEEQCYAKAVEESVAQEAGNKPAPKKRGSPRKYLFDDTRKPVEALQTKISPTSRYRRKRKTKVNELASEEAGTDDPEFTPVTTLSKKRRVLQPYRVKRNDNFEVQRKKVAVSTGDADVSRDTIELVRWQNELTKEQLEQKVKDRAECFGFDDDEETAMPTLPETKNMIQVNDDQ